VKSTQSYYLEERRQVILLQLSQQGRVSVADLSRQFGVSEVTIRADLQALAGQRLLVRTHGGAVPSSNGMGELALALRRHQQVREKGRIGEAGAEMVADGDAIFLDSSSTSLAIAHHLRQRRHLTIITNSLAIAQEMLDVDGVSVVMTGGTLQRETASLVNIHALELVRQFNIRHGFFGAHGISLADGLTDVSTAVAEVKRPLVKACRQVFAVVDETKWGRVGVASFATMADVDMVITNRGACPNLVAQVRNAGVDVIIV
jgi:DeoR/GlpR family transcriptional regulator of sugar metabolism